LLTGPSSKVSRFLPHSKLLVDHRSSFDLLRVDKPPGVFQPLLSNELLVHRNRPLGHSGRENESRKHPFLPVGHGNCTTLDVPPSPSVKTLGAAEAIGHTLMRDVASRRSRVVRNDAASLHRLRRPAWNFFEGLPLCKNRLARVAPISSASRALAPFQKEALCAAACACSQSLFRRAMQMDARIESVSVPISREGSPQPSPDQTVAA